MEKTATSWDTANYPSTTLFCLKARVKPVRVNCSLGKPVLSDIGTDWEVQGSTPMPEARGRLHPTVTSGATWPPLPWQSSQCPKFYTGFPLLILQPQFQHAALGQTTSCTDRWSFALVGEGLVNGMNYTSPQLQNRYEQVLCWQLRAPALFHLF